MSPPNFSHLVNSVHAIFCNQKEIKNMQTNVNLRSWKSTSGTIFIHSLRKLSSDEYLQRLKELILGGQSDLSNIQG